MTDILKLIINLHDGDSAAAESGAENNDGATTNTETISNETRARAARIGIGDDLLEDYNRAFGNKNNAEGESNSEESDNEEDIDSEFEKLIKGKYKNVYQNKMSTAIKDRISSKDKQIADLQKKGNTSNKIISLLANKYPNVKSDDLDALYKAVSEDNDLFSDKALESGMTAEEARNKFFSQQERAEEQEELETLRREKAARELDSHLRTLAAETQKEFPNFNLEREFQNPAFRTALDYIANQRNAENEKTGRNDEVYDLTEAYKMAHWKDIQSDLVKRSSSAAISAAAQSIQSGAKRPTENAVRKNGLTSERKSVSDMTDAEFNAFYEKVRRGEAHI